MANKTIAITSELYSGTVGMKLFLLHPTTGAIGNNASGDVLTEGSNGLFTTVVDEAITGWYRVLVTDSVDSPLIEGGWVLITSDTVATYVVDDPSALVSNVAVYPTQLQQEDRNVEGPIKIYTGETGQQFFFVLDSNLQPVDLTGKNLELRFADSGAKKTLYTAKTSNATISVSLTNKVTFTKSVDFTRFEMSTLRFSLRDIGAGGEVILTGPVKLIWAP